MRQVARGLAVPVAAGDSSEQGEVFVDRRLGDPVGKVLGWSNCNVWVSSRTHTLFWAMEFRSAKCYAQAK